MSAYARAKYHLSSKQGARTGTQHRASASATSLARNRNRQRWCVSSVPCLEALIWPRSQPVWRTWPGLGADWRATPPSHQGKIARSVWACTPTPHGCPAFAAPEASLSSACGVRRREQRRTAPLLLAAAAGRYRVSTCPETKSKTSFYYYCYYMVFATNRCSRV